YQILTPGCDALVRVYLYASASGPVSVPAVSMRVRGSSSAITLTCPTSLPLYDGDVNLSYSLSGTCYGTLPGSLVNPG
ncbi:hypothetical protein, partial [Mucilaginibacter sp. 5C4]